MISQSDRQLLEALYHVAVNAAHPDQAIAKFAPEPPRKPPRGRTIVVGAGKASAQMAAALERHWEAHDYGPISGTIITRYGFGAECKHIDILEAAHPVPDAAGLRGTQALFDTLHGLTPDDLVIALISGGGSALLPAPLEGLTLDDEIALNEALLASGAPIGAMNTIRKQISGIKGGRLALAAAPARVHSLLISDIPGDIPSFIASGPTIADTTNRADALAAIAHYNIQLSAKILAFLANAPETAPLPTDPRLKRNSHHIIASAAVSLDAVAAHAKAQGLNAMILSDSMEGEAREVGLFHAAIARQIALTNGPVQKPAILLSGGEATVTIRPRTTDTFNGNGQGQDKDKDKGQDKGKGGRNTEFLLSFAHAIAGLEGITALAADTDGIDGSEDNAGAFADGATSARLHAFGGRAEHYLNRNDAWTAFDTLGDIFKPGPSGTNVNDLRAIIIR